MIIHRLRTLFTLEAERVFIERVIIANQKQLLASAALRESTSGHFPHSF